VRHHELGSTTPRNRGVIPARRGIGRCEAAAKVSFRVARNSEGSCSPGRRSVKSDCSLVRGHGNDCAPADQSNFVLIIYVAIKGPRLSNIAHIERVRLPEPGSAKPVHLNGKNRLDNNIETSRRAGLSDLQIPTRLLHSPQRSGTGCGRAARHAPDESGNQAALPVGNGRPGSQ
jgi:hypothetical protein